MEFKISEQEDYDVEKNSLFGTLPQEARARISNEKNGEKKKELFENALVSSLIRAEKSYNKMLKIAEKNPRGFLDHVRKVIKNTTRDEFKKHIKPIEERVKKQIGGLTLNEEQRLQIYIRTKTRTYKDIAREAGIKWEGIDELIGTQSLRMMEKPIFPERMVSPKDLISNKIWGGEVPYGEITPIVTADTKGGKFGVVLKVDYDKLEKDPYVTITGNLDEAKRAVHDAVVTLMVAGANLITLEQIHKVITQNPKAKLTPRRKIEIGETISYERGHDVTIVTDSEDETGRDLWDVGTQGLLKPERKKYTDVMPYVQAKMLECRVAGYAEVSLKNRKGEEVAKKMVPTAIYMTAPPILYQYAASKGQVATTEMKLLNTNKQKKGRLNRNLKTDAIANFLHRQIETMKHNKDFSRIIRWETLYEMDGIDKVQADENSLKQKRSRTRTKIEKLLTDFKENGFIAGYENHKKKVGRGMQFYSVEIKI